MLICVSADKGSPGVTTLAVALASVWPRPVILAEVDPAGGDLLYRVTGPRGELDPSRGVMSLAVAARRDVAPDVVAAHTQRLRGEVPVLLGPSAPAQASVLAGMWARLGSLLAAVPETDVLADCGRLGADAGFAELLAHARLILLVVRDSADQVAHLCDRVATLSASWPASSRPRLAVVVCGGPGRTKAADEVATLMTGWQLPVTVAGTIPLDTRSADVLNGRIGGVAPERGDSLLGQARVLADSLVDSVGERESAPWQVAPRQEVSA